MTTVKDLIVVSVFLLLVSCNKEKRMDFYVVAFPDDNELIVFRFGENLRMVTKDSCYNKYNPMEYICDETLQLSFNEPINEFRVEVYNNSQKIIDTTIMSKDPLKLIGVGESNSKKEERVYYYTTENYYDPLKEIK